MRVYILLPLVFIVYINALTDVVFPGSFDMNSMLCEREMEDHNDCRKREQTAL